MVGLAVGLRVVGFDVGLRVVGLAVAVVVGRADVGGTGILVGLRVGFKIMTLVTRKRVKHKR